MRWGASWRRTVLIPADFEHAEHAAKQEVGGGRRPRRVRVRVIRGFSSHPRRLIRVRISVEKAVTRRASVRVRPQPTSRRANRRPGATQSVATTAVARGIDDSVARLPTHECNLDVRERRRAVEGDLWRGHHHLGPVDGPREIARAVAREGTSPGQIERQRHRPRDVGC